MRLTGKQAPSGRPLNLPHLYISSTGHLRSVG
jgi:hypothetical protein